MKHPFYLGLVLVALVFQFFANARGLSLFSMMTFAGAGPGGTRSGLYHK